MSKSLRDKFRGMVSFINDNLIAEERRDIYDPGKDLSYLLNDDGSMGDSTTYIPITTTMALLNSCLGKNTLIEGGPGSGKTKLAGVIGSMLFQIPYQVFEFMRVVGNPGATVNEIYATQDIALLNKGEDAAFLYKPFLFPFLVMDELNRFSSLEQNRIREGVACHIWSYANNHTWQIPQVVISAINPQVYEGTFILNENLLDNYSIMLEPPLTDSMLHENIIIKADERINDALGLNEGIKDFFDFYTKNKNNFEELRIKVSELQERMASQLKNSGLLYIHNGELKSIKKEIEGITLLPEAMLFKHAVKAEMDYSHEIGRVRLEGPASSNDHDKNYLAGKLSDGSKGRFDKDWEGTAKMIAWYFNKKEVGIPELKASFIYTASHRLKPTEEFFQAVYTKQRELPVKFEIAKSVIEQVWDNYSSFYDNGNNKGFNAAVKAINIINDNTDDATGYVNKNELNDAIKILKHVDHPISKSLLKIISTYTDKNRR